MSPRKPPPEPRKTKVRQHERTIRDRDQPPPRKRSLAELFRGTNRKGSR